MKRAPTLTEHWDVIVIGGGPAGMMAAITAADRGRRVLLLEKNPSLGKKLLITGGGRCNVTNAEADLRKLLGRYKGSDQFLFSAFSQYDNKSTLQFFNGQGMPTKIENEGRVFPVSDSARSVYEVLTRSLAAKKVTVICDAAATGLVAGSGGALAAVRLGDGSQLTADSFILATGGSSRPETGSTGEAFSWLKELGHRVTPPNRALVPLALKDTWHRSLAGVSLADCKLTVLLDGEKQSVRKGRMLFTHVGITGPTVLNLSRSVGELLPYGDVVLALDLFPSSDHGALKEKLYTLLAAENGRKIKNSLALLAPSALVGPVLTLAGVDPEKTSHSVSRTERVALIALMKAIPLRVAGLLGNDKAIVSSGGVSLSEVNFKTMQSRLISNLFLAGDVLDVDRPSGGYSLQLCWTTGFVAGSNA